MKVWIILVCLGITSPALAQDVTCTADVPTDTCKLASELFLAPFRSQIPFMSQIVIADPASFRREQESLERRYETDIRLGKHRNRFIAHRWAHDVLLVRDDEPCPTRVVISTDAFRPVLKIKVGPEGKYAGSEYGEGFHPAIVASVANYVDGFLQGCNWGVVFYVEELLVLMQEKKK